MTQDQDLIGQIEDIRRLQDCINNLVSLLALPAMWSGRKPFQVADSLIDTLLRMLRLDFIYARVNVLADRAPIEVCRVAPQHRMMRRSPEVGRALEPWLKRDALSSAGRVPNPLGEGEVSIAHCRLGLEKETGAVVAGCRRDGFPDDIEMLLLRVAVNQAFIELQRAQILAVRSEAETTKRLKDQLHAENIYLRRELDNEQHWGEIVGECKALKRVLKLVEQVAPTHACVLIEGETGTGKGLVARAIHRLSDRKEQPFVELNCAAIPTGLLEAELFGHEKGAFTGAVAQRIGRFELANGGTIFLDEVGEIPLELQAKLLRVLQEQVFERLGSPRTTHVGPMSTCV